MTGLERDLTDLLLAHLLPAARALGMLVFLPGFSAPAVPAQVRLLLAAGLALLTSCAAGASAPLPTGAEALIAGLVSEIGLGLVVGWAVSVFFESLRWAGEILDMQLGLRAGQFFDPLSATGSSMLGQLYSMTALTFFFVMDGHHWVLAAIVRSFSRIPPGQLAIGAPTLQILLAAATSALDIGIRMASAGITALLVADVALAVVGRHVPQMNVFIVGIPAKLGGGLLVLALTAPMLTGVFGNLIAEVRHYVWLLLGR